MDYRYHLAKYAGTSSRLICPNCGKRELVPYIDDETGKMLHETCGRCNRESNCGYHLTPSQYFNQNPGARPQGDDWRRLPDWALKKQQELMLAPKKNTKGHICELPKDIVRRTVTMTPKSNCVRYLETIFDPVIVEGLVYEYQLGVTKSLETIFYQIDGKGRYRGGKVIQYDPQTGHRIKDNQIPVNWVHPAFKKAGYITQDWEMTQCLFGEHLLEEYPDKPVCLVEAEKTAVICAGYVPSCIWVAVGGKTQLGDKLNVLIDRKFVVYPDIDATDNWLEWFGKHPYLSAIVSMYLEENCTDEDREAQVDIADILIRCDQQVFQPVPGVPPEGGTEHLARPYQAANPVAQEVAKYFSAEVMPNVESFIDEFDLQFVGVSVRDSKNDLPKDKRDEQKEDL